MLTDSKLVTPGEVRHKTYTKYGGKLMKEWKTVFYKVRVKHEMDTITTVICK